MTHHISPKTHMQSGGLDLAPRFARMSAARGSGRCQENLYVYMENDSLVTVLETIDLLQIFIHRDHLRHLP